MPTAAQTTSLHTVIAGLAGGSPVGKIVGTKQSGPIGIESIIEYRSKSPVYLNAVDWVDTFIIVTVNGIDSADLRASAQVNPGEIGETPSDALWGGRTITLSGKQYAGTIWKLRDMQQGLRGAFLDVKTEYPLIFHALDPANDLMIMCKLADKINIPDQQTQKNQHVRDFQITLRASNPRFLSVVREQQAMITLSSAITFDKDNYPIVENFSVSAGLSNSYVEKGHGYSPGSDLLMQRDLLRNMIVNSRGETPGSPLSNIHDGYNWTSGAGTPSMTTVIAGGGLYVPDLGALGPAFLLTTTNGPGRRQAEVEFASHTGDFQAPPVAGGDRLRVTGWISFDTIPEPEASVGIAIRWWWYPSVAGPARTLAPVPLTDAGFVVKPTVGAWTANTWYRVDATVTVPAQPSVKAFPAAVFYVGYIPGSEPYIPNIGPFKMRVAEPMMDIDRDPTRGVLYGDGTFAGWAWEGNTKDSISRRKMTFANLIRNTRAYIAATNSQVAGRGASAFVRIQDSTPAKMNNFVGHDTWWRLTSDGTGSGQGPVPPNNALKTPMGIQWNYTKVAEKTTYNLSFYTRALTVGRPVYVSVGWIVPGNNPGIPTTIIVPVQTHGSDGKDAPNEWRRFWADIPVPAGALAMIPTMFFTNDDETAIPSGEQHEVSAAMLCMGAGPRAYRDASGTVGGRLLPEYTWAGAVNDSATLGPWGLRNLLPDSDNNKADNSSKTAVASVLSKVSAGGVVDSGQFSRATYDSSSAFYMGVATQAAISERTAYSASAYVRLDSGATGSRSAVIDIWWYQDTVSPATKIASTMSPYAAITSDWSEIRLDNVTPPDKATIAVVRVLLANPVPGDVIDTDRTMLFNAPQSEGWFGVKSEWSQPADPASPYGEALRYAYSSYQTPRQFYECQQTVRIFLPTANTGDDTIHLAVAYIDDDNQIYASMENPDLMTLCRLDLGVFTELARVTLTTQLDGNQYYFRARMSDGVLFAEAGRADMDNPDIYNSTPPVQLKYVMPSVDVVKYQDVLLPMRFGIQARGGNWVIDEWRYYDLPQPEGWKLFDGAGTVTVKGGKLAPMDASKKLMVRNDLPYKISDAAIGMKVKLTDLPADGTTWEVGLAGKVNSAGNTFIYATWGHTVIPAQQSGYTYGFHLGVFVDGVKYEILTEEGNMPQGIDIWFRLVTTGTIVTVEEWRTDPALGGSPHNDVGWDLIDPVLVDQIPNLLANFGAGVKGDFGIYWPRPLPLTNVIDDFSFVLVNFDDIAFKLQNKGNFEAQTTINLSGPMTNPRVTNEANNTSFKINATIPAGETWVLENVGPSKRMYRKSDGANRFQYLDQTSMWIVLEPDNLVNNIRLTATSLAAGWDMQVIYRHTYM